MKRIILSGYYGFKNAGDEAILAALIDNFKNSRADIEIIVLSSNPEWTRSVHGVKAISRTSSTGLIRYLKGADLLISGGGSLLQDVTSNKTIPYYLGVILLAKIFKVPVFFCAQGVGPINNIFNRRLVKAILNRVNLITVRDVESKELLEEIGIREDIHLTADPVFALPKSNQERVKDILKIEGIKAKENILGISLRPWQDNSYLKQMAEILDGLKERLDINILFIPFHYPVDVEVSRRVAELMKNKTEIITNSYTPQEVLGLIGEVDMLLGVRLHSLIFAALNRVPLIGISYDPKIDSFLNRLELSALAKIDNLDISEVIGEIIGIWSRKEELQRVIKKKINNLEGLARQNIELSLGILGDNS
ncbi:polysaccharide pyruvyl transferase CsaB [Orenia metallireducens]|uniref:Polysaccharide pyruvyl transferase CsaB n=1 Tax=Orenia metallireducens TaxID=1413210 RepID=A0A1C0A5V5_9FIRM|nr:polysaccharide pyruvyl transferase CsaB [Orenia metallireducens]OCL25476.1 polysaccharide pyruvyl transferase CsaB [Orenia metallireducens]